MTSSGSRHLAAGSQRYDARAETVGTWSHLLLQISGCLILHINLMMSSGMSGPSPSRIEPYTWLAA